MNLDQMLPEEGRVASVDLAGGAEDRLINKENMRCDDCDSYAGERSMA